MTNDKHNCGCVASGSRKDAQLAELVHHNTRVGNKVVRYSEFLAYGRRSFLPVCCSNGKLNAKLNAQFSHAWASFTQSLHVLLSFRTHGVLLTKVLHLLLGIV